MKEADRVARPKLSILRNLVDRFLFVEDDNVESSDDDLDSTAALLQVANSDFGGSGTVSEPRVSGTKDSRPSRSESEGDTSDNSITHRKRSRSRRRSLDASLGSETFAKIKIGVKMVVRTDQSIGLKKSTSIDMKADNDSAEIAPLPPLPDLEVVQSRLMQLEEQTPALRYSIVCNEVNDYYSFVTGLLRGIESDPSYSIYAVRP